jgi:hypothetical protein
MLLLHLMLLLLLYLEGHHQLGLRHQLPFRQLPFRQ